MFQGVKVPVYYIKGGSPRVPESSPDHNLHILPATISLNHIPLLFLGRGTETLVCYFTPPPLHKTLITPHVFSPFLYYIASMLEAPGKPLSCISLCKKRAARSPPISNTMLLENFLDRIFLAREIKF
jgi:hypothetical protein